MADTRIRWATENDAALIVHFIRALAIFEKEPVEQVRITEADVLRDGFGSHRRFEVLIAEVERKAVGFALFFPNYSTWEGKPGLYIEDIFVDESMRGTGIGRKLIAAVAKIGKSRGCARIDLAVLNWNPARGFYNRIGFRHAEPWQIFRLAQSGLEALSKEASDFVV
ncbi:MAG TPA: GNAT family N-acetyltransferase [Candidatus Binataceae bacterium]|nr:GNAT family N-acetyltransferase [Candidatus Binataceae bacterium]